MPLPVPLADPSRSAPRAAPRAAFPWHRGLPALLLLAACEAPSHGKSTPAPEPATCGAPIVAAPPSAVCATPSLARIEVDRDRRYMPLALDAERTSLIGWPTRETGVMDIWSCLDGAWGGWSHDLRALTATAADRGLAGADLDGDGDLDLGGLVYADYATVPHVRVLLNEGGFFTELDYPELRATDLEFGDLDGDGLQDLVTSLPGGYVQLYRQEDGGFSSARTIGEVPPEAVGVALAVGDVDADGRCDVAAGLDLDAAEAQLWLAWNGEDGWEVERRALADAWEPGRPHVGDLDGDGDHDLALADRLLLFDGRAAEETLTDARVDGPLLDLDGDGDLDRAGLGEGLVRALRNDGEGPVTLAEETWPGGESVGFADLSGDGLPDLLVQELEDGGVVAVYANLADGRFAVPAASVREPEDLALADFDGDGLLDAASTTNGEALALLSGTGAGLGAVERLTSDVWTDEAPYEGVEACDLDADGDPDLVVLAQHGGILLGHSDAGMFTWEWTTSPDASGNSRFERLLCADFDGDGAGDLVVSGYGGLTEGTWRARNEAGTFSFAATSGTRGTDLDAADLDGDGRLDLLVLAEREALLEIDWGTGERTTIDVPGGAEALDVADLDGDGDADLAIGEGRSLMLYANGGDGSFGGRVLASELNAEAIVALDADGAPPLDLAVAIGDEGDDGVGTLGLVLRDGAGVTVVRRPSGGVDPRALVAADLDGDGLDDLVVANREGYTVTQLLSTRLAP